MRNDIRMSEREEGSEALEYGMVVVVPWLQP